MAAAAQVACGSFARYFFAGADDAVQQYACQTLVSAVEDGDSLTGLMDVLADFLPTGGSRQALLKGLQQLEHVLRQQEQQQAAYVWLQQLGAAQERAAAAVSADSAGPHRRPTQPQEQQQNIHTATLQSTSEPTNVQGAPVEAPATSAQPQLGHRPSQLSVAAAEFRPGGAAAASLAAGLASMQLDRSGRAAERSADAGSSSSWAWSGADGAATTATGAAGSQGSMNDRQGGWQYSEAYWQYDAVTGSTTAASAVDAVGPYSLQHYPAPAATAEAAEDSDMAVGAAVASERVAGGAAAEAAFLAVLAEQFPLFSEDALLQLFKEQGRSLAATIHTLCSLEAELEGQQHAGGSGSSAYGGYQAGSTWPGGALGSLEPPAPSFSEEDFPTLGTSSGGSSSSNEAGGAGSLQTTQPPANYAQTSNASISCGSTQYASRARAAVHLPAQPAQRGPTARPSSTAPASAAGAAAPAPIWRQAEGVQRFSTGAEVAAEYAELRADARDHARLRNAYFQQATQAYLVGNRALARDLGAQGRWHGEQMHAAHQAAASQLFARRNPGVGGGGNASASSGGRSHSGVPTVDLHGLHVSEALQQLERMLLRLQQGSTARAKRLRVVVGVGQHGKVPARLPAAVRLYLEGQGLQFTETYAGMLEVKL